MTRLWFLEERGQESSYPNVRRSRVTEDSCFISYLTWEAIYGWDEPTDRRTGSELAYICLSRVWMYLPEASRPDDVDSYVRPERKVRSEISPVTSGIPLQASLAVTLHPEAWRWAETRIYECHEALWYDPYEVWWRYHLFSGICTYVSTIYRWDREAAQSDWVDQFSCSCDSGIFCQLYLYAALAGEICSLACETIHWLWARDPLYATPDAVWDYGDQYDPDI